MSLCKTVRADPNCVPTKFVPNSLVKIPVNAFVSAPLLVRPTTVLLEIPTTGLCSVNPGVPGTAGGGANGGFAGDACDGAVLGGANAPGGALGGLLACWAWTLRIPNIVKMQRVDFIVLFLRAALNQNASSGRYVRLVKVKLKPRGKRLHGVLYRGSVLSLQRAVKELGRCIRAAAGQGRRPLRWRFLDAPNNNSGSGVLLACSQVVDILHQAGFHFFSGDNGIDQPVIEEEFCGLKSRRQLCLSSVFNHPWAGEPNHCAWFSKD